METCQVCGAKHSETIYCPECKKSEYKKMGRGEDIRTFPPKTEYKPALSECHNCDFCGAHPNTIIDGRTDHGHWAWMCTECHEEYGVGFGLGKGQEFINEKGGIKLRG